jgi:hypothetical protein
MAQSPMRGGIVLPGGTAIEQLESYGRAARAITTRWEMPHHMPDRMLEVRRRLAAGPPTRTNRSP